MSDLTRCGYCGATYWTSSYENWGTCTKCCSNNDLADKDHRPSLASEFKEPLLDKAVRAVEESECENSL